jgi:hypothetical protein
MQRRTGGTSCEGRGRQNYNEKEGPRMKTVKRFVAIAVSGVVFACYSASGIAQQVTGVLGSPSANLSKSRIYA